MSGYLRRLATTGAAYTASSIVSKLIAVLLLPLYTRYLTPSDYGAAEVMFAAVVTASIVVRLGVIEALLRFYYMDGEDPAERRRHQLRRPLLVGAAGVLLALPFASRSRRRCSTSPPLTSRGSRSLGLWALTLFEFCSPCCGSTSGRGPTS